MSMIDGTMSSLPMITCMILIEYYIMVDCSFGFPVLAITSCHSEYAIVLYLLHIKFFATAILSPLTAHKLSS